MFKTTIVAERVRVGALAPPTPGVRRARGRHPLRIAPGLGPERLDDPRVARAEDVVGGVFRLGRGISPRREALGAGRERGGHRRGEPDGGSHPREIGAVDGDAVRRGGTARRGGLEAPALALGQRGFIIIGALLADDPDDATAASGRADAHGEREAGRG